MTNKGNREPSRLKNFLWWCAGVDEQTMLQCPTEWAKYASMGATILFTGLFAGFAGGYACYTIFRSGELGSIDIDIVALFPSILFGFFWGLMIFNIDRYIITSFHKSNSINQSDRFWSNAGQAIPRFVMAVIIAFTISKPLEVKIMENELQQAIQDDYIAKITENDSVWGTYYNISGHERIIASTQLKSDSLKKIGDEEQDAPQVKHLRDQIEKNNKTISNSDVKIKNAQTEATSILENAKKGGIASLDSLPDGKKRWRITDPDLEKRRNNLRRTVSNERKQIDSLNTDIKALEDSIKNTNKRYWEQIAKEKQETDSIRIEQENEKNKAEAEMNKDVERSNAVAKQSHSNRFATQLIALHRLKYPNLEEFKEPEVPISPMVINNVDSLDSVKNVQQSTFIEQNRIRNIKQEEIISKAKETKLISWFLTILFLVIELTPLLTKLIIKRGAYDNLLDLEEKKIENVIEAEARISTEIVEEKVRTETKTNADLMKKITTTQAALIEVAIEEWRQEELQKIKENPSAYIETTTSKS